MTLIHQMFVWLPFQVIVRLNSHSGEDDLDPQSTHAISIESSAQFVFALLQFVHEISGVRQIGVGMSVIEVW